MKISRQRIHFPKVYFLLCERQSGLSSQGWKHCTLDPSFWKCYLLHMRDQREIWTTKASLLVFYYKLSFCHPWFYLQNANKTRTNWEIFSLCCLVEEHIAPFTGMQQGCLNAFPVGFQLQITSSFAFSMTWEHALEPLDRMGQHIPLFSSLPLLLMCKNLKPPQPH